MKYNKVTLDEVLNFWFNELSPKDWFSASEKVDSQLRERYFDLHKHAAACELFYFRATPEGRLAEILILDQFSRNIHRGTAAAFASDPLALALAQEAVAAGIDAKISLGQKAFLYMPFMHSESLAIHEEAVKLFTQAGLQSNLEFELRHKKIIERFGRYPHRNVSLGRHSTEAELEFLKIPGSGF